MATWVHVVFSWGESSVRALRVLPGRTLCIGEGGDVSAATERLGGERVELLRVGARGDVRLVLPRRAHATVRVPGECPRALAAGEEQRLPQGSTADVALFHRGGPSCHRARAGRGPAPLVFALTVVSGPPPREGLRRPRLRDALVGAGALIAHALIFAGAFHSTPALSSLEFDDHSSRPLHPPRSVPAPYEPPDFGGHHDPRPGREPPVTWVSLGLVSARIGNGVLETTRPEGGWVVPPELRACYSGHPRAPVRLGGIGVASFPRADGTRPGPDVRVGAIAVRGSIFASDDSARGEVVVGGRRARQIVRDAVSRAASRFHWCYERALVDDPALHARVAMGVVWRVDDEPEILGAALGGEDLDAALSCCLRGAQRDIAEAAWPAVGSATYSVTLRPPR